ncbi:MAG: hypothetical protein RL670_1172 [Actinomycetota bacterium]
MSASGRLNIGVVGAGPVGTLLATALGAAGHSVVAASASSPSNLERLETLLPGVPVQSVPEVIAAADLVLLTIPSKDLEKTVSGYTTAGLWHPGQLLVHTAGEFGFTALAAATTAGVIPIAIHPAMRFTGTSIDLTRMRESYFAVSAPNVALPIAEALVLEMGGEPIVIAENQRAAYFEAVSVASDFSALLVSQAIGLLEQAGVADPRAVLGPIVRSAVDQALNLGHVPLNPDELLD